MTFKELNIIQPILKAIEEKGYNRPTPIQQQAIPVALSRKDILGCAQTGTGKTASFAIPIIQLLQADRAGIWNPFDLQTGAGPDFVCPKSLSSPFLKGLVV